MMPIADNLRMMCRDSRGNQETKHVGRVDRQTEVAVYRRLQCLLAREFHSTSRLYLQVAFHRYLIGYFEFADCMDSGPGSP
ncbi:unnamed protein product [Gongylonema pulchrum]|uniref:Transposase n=1 Tax=Gongylonema pulchrum TaxID=637853 RepID=A0A183DF14_9BILA|nr:unnamed protein product [Gongylonema pulchrum]